MICTHCNNVPGCIFRIFGKALLWTIITLFVAYGFFAIGVTLLEMMIDSPVAIDMFNISDDSVVKIRNFLDTLTEISEKILPQETS